LFGVAGALAGGGQVGAAIFFLVAAAMCIEQVGEPAFAVGRCFLCARFDKLHQEAFDIGFVELGK
jgi:hypothetical protein